MRPGQHAHLVRCLASIWLVLSAACHNSSPGTPVPPVVVTTLPRDGAADVEPDVAVILDLESPAQHLTAAEVLVRDGGNRLPGTVRRIGDSASWSWTPDYELPRGSRIVVATARQGVVTTFTVRDIVLAGTLQLADEEASAAFSWPNGRRAVLTRSGRVFEVTAPSWVERFVALGPFAWTYGNGDFISFENDGGVWYCVRGNLDGSMDRVPLPGGALVGHHNARGDVVVFVPSTPATASYSGLWRLLRGEASFAPAGPLAVEQGQTRHRGTIEPDGTVALAYPESGVVRLSRFAPGDLVGEHHDLALTGGDSLGRVHYDAGADGRGVLALVVRETASLRAGAQDDVVQLARFEPGVGLRFLSSDVLRRPVITGGPAIPYINAEAHVGDWGSTCVLVSWGIREKAVGSHNKVVVRVEVDDRLTTSQNLLFTSTHPSNPYAPQGFSRSSPLRGEMWAMKFDFSEIELTRSRPGADVDLTLLTGGSHPYARFAFDDAGRAVVAWTERSGPFVTTQIHFWD